MEPNTPTTAPAVQNNQGNGFKIATIVASIIAVCGIGFGVYGMVKSNQKDTEISDLKVQIKNSDGTTTTIETPKIETTTDNATIITIEDSTMGTDFAKYSATLLQSNVDRETYSEVIQQYATIYSGSLTIGSYTIANDVLSAEFVDTGNAPGYTYLYFINKDGTVSRTENLGSFDFDKAPTVENNIKGTKYMTPADENNIIELKNIIWIDTVNIGYSAYDELGLGYGGGLYPLAVDIEGNAFVVIQD